jgi:hypothetical protein
VAQSNLRPGVKNESVEQLIMLANLSRVLDQASRSELSCSKVIYLVSEDATKGREGH